MRYFIRVTSEFDENVEETRVLWVSDRDGRLHEIDRAVSFEKTEAKLVLREVQDSFRDSFFFNLVEMIRVQ